MSFPFLCPPRSWLILPLIILFQGSEWNAANMEELHKNKSVLHFFTPVLIVAVYLWFSASPSLVVDRVCFLLSQHFS